MGPSNAELWKPFSTLSIVFVVYYYLFFSLKYGVTIKTGLIALSSYQINHCYLNSKCPIRI